MQPSDFDWQGGKIMWWGSIEQIEKGKHVYDAGVLGEDLALIRYSNGISLDIGWYGGRDGCFAIYVVHDATGWQSPVHKHVLLDPTKLCDAIEYGIAVALKAVKWRKKGK